MDFISIDLGKNGAVAKWHDNKFVKITSWKHNNKKYEVENLVTIFNIFSEEIKDVDLVVVEQPSRSMPQQWILFYDLRGMTLYTGKTFKAFMPMTIKKEVTGYGRADKDQMASAVQASGLVYCELNGEHEYDAVGVGICYLRKNNGG